MSNPVIGPAAAELSYSQQDLQGVVSLAIEESRKLGASAAEAGVSVEFCHTCSRHIDTDYNVEGEYRGGEYVCERCCEKYPAPTNTRETFAQFVKRMEATAGEEA